MVLLLLLGTACDNGGSGADAGPVDPGRDGAIPTDTDSGPSLDTGLDLADAADSDSLVLPDVEDDALDITDVASDPGQPAHGFVPVDLTAVGDIRAAWASQEASIWLVGDRGLVLRFNGSDYVPLRPPTDRDLNGVAGEGKTVVVVGAAGTVLRYDGSAWSELAPPVAADLYGVGVVSADDFYVAGAKGTLLHYSSGKWKEEHPGTQYDLLAVHASKVGGVFVVGQSGTLFELKGTVWIQSQIAGPASHMRSIWRSPDGKVFAVGTRGAVAVYDGIVWKLAVTNDTYDPPRDLYDVFGFSGEEVYAVGDKGAILKHDGKKWTLMTIAGPYNVFSDFRAVSGVLEPDGSRTVVAAGLDAKAVELDGKAWKDRRVGVTADLRGIWVRPDGSAIIAGSHGLLLSYDGAGRFDTIASGVTADLNAVSGDVAVGASGTLLSLSGNQVSTLDSGTDETLTDVWTGKDGSWIVGAGGSVIHVSEGKVETLTGLMGVPLTAVYSGDPDRVWMAGEGGVMHLRDATGIHPIITGTFSSLWDLWGGGDGKVWAVGDNGIVLSCVPTQCTRVHEEPASFLYGIGGTAPDRVLIVGWAGAALKLQGGTVSALDSGTHRVFRAVAGGAGGGPLYLVGLDGTFVKHLP